MPLEIVIVILTGSNILFATLWAFSQLAGKNKQVVQLSKLISRFERERSVLLHIEAVDSDNVYLRNPAGKR